MQKARLFLTGAAILSLSTAYAQTNTTVFSNNVGGDAFTAPNSDQMQAIGTSGWYYANVRNGSTVGIDPSKPDPSISGSDGSVHFTMPDNGANPTGKADVEYYAWNVADPSTYATSAGLGTLGNLTSLSYDWFKDGASTTSSATAPAIRLLLSNGGSDFHYLVFEDYTNNGGSSVSNQWVNDAVGSSSQLWLTHDGGNGTEHDRTLSDWQSGLGYDTAINANTKVMGISFGVGSGWNGYFNGWVDNVSIGFNNQVTNYNFQVQSVPEPAAVALPALLLGFGLIKLRSRS